MTCRKARKFLVRKGVQVQEREFFRQPFTETELRRILKDRPGSEAFSWKAPSVKALGLTGKELTNDELIAWMLREPRLIKRSIIVVGERVFFRLQVGGA